MMRRGEAVLSNKAITAADAARFTTKVTPYAAASASATRAGGTSAAPVPASTAASSIVRAAVTAAPAAGVTPWSAISASGGAEPERHSRRGQNQREGEQPHSPPCDEPGRSEWP